MSFNNTFPFNLLKGLAITIVTKAAGLVEVARGSGGASSTAKPLNEITFLDIYNAIECVDHGELFRCAL